MRNSTKVLAAAVITGIASLATATNGFAQGVGVGKNGLTYGQHTTATVSTSGIGSVTVQRMAPNSGFSTMNFVCCWESAGTASIAGGQASIDLDSYVLGTGDTAVRAITESGPTPAFLLSVYPTSCTDDITLHVKNATGPGALVAGTGASWTARFEVTACKDVSRAALSLGGFAMSYLDQLANPLFTQNGRAIRTIRLGDLKAGQSAAFDIAISGFAPGSSLNRLEIAPQWTLDYLTGKTNQTRYLLEPITIDLLRP